jgi:hypothetical protein
MVAGMVATLAFVVGLLMGAGGFFGYVKNSEGAAGNLGISSTAAADCPEVKTADGKECPACKECPESGSDSGSAPTYALVYPIEQTLIIEGKLKPEFLKEYVIKRRFKMQECYQRILEKDPSVKGEISLQFTASESGEIVAAVSRQDTVKSKELKECVLAEIKTWKFEKGAIESTLAVVKFDVLFTPIGSGGP